MDESTTYPDAPAVRVARVLGPAARRTFLRPPPVTIALAFANLAMAFLQFAASGFHMRGLDLGNSGVEWLLGAKVPSLIAHGEYWRLVTANFLHASWFTHLGVNVLCLLILGAIVESCYGSARTFVIYVIACVSGTVLSYFFTPFVSLGASTGVMGLLGALLVHNYRYRKHLPSRLNAVYPLLIVLVAVQFGLDFLNQNVDVMGHLGGLLGGAVVGMLLAAIHAPRSAQRPDRISSVAAVSVCAGLLAYGGLGLAWTAPREAELQQIASATRGDGQIDPLLKLLHRRPYFIEGRLLVVGLLARRGRLEQANALFWEGVSGAPRQRRRIMRSPPAQALALANYGRSQGAFQRGMWELGISSSLQTLALATDPTMIADAHNQVAWILVDKLARDLPEAERHVQESLRIFPRNPEYLDTLAWIRYKQGRLPEALAVQSDAVRLAAADPSQAGPALADLYYHLGMIHEKQGHPEEALEAYRKVLRSRPDYPEVNAALHRLFPPARPPSPGLPAPSQDPAVTRGIL